MLQWLFGKRKEQPQQKPKKSSAQQQAQDKWKYDFLIQFLSGPLWKTSILDFVDYHCVVFDNEEENKFEYTTLHNKFKELVGNLFDGMIQQVGLDDQKLAELLEKGFQSKHKKIFNQLLLADDFLKFKKLMVNRNKLLQAQAIKALSESQARHAQEKPQKHKKQYNPKQKQILKQSKRLEQERKRAELQQEEQLRKVLELSRLQAQQKQSFSRLQAKARQNQLKQSQLQAQHVQQKHAPQKSQPEVIVKQEPLPIKQAPKVIDAPVILPPVRRRKKVEQSPKIQEKVEKQQQKPAQVPQPIIQQKKPEPVVDQNESQSQEQRKKRLLEQREKIRKRKQQERKKQMAQQQSKSAPQVQTIVLQQDGIHETQLRAPEQEKKQKVNNQQLERRRELMRKIKNRIVDDF